MCERQVIRVHVYKGEAGNGDEAEEKGDMDREI